MRNLRNYREYTNSMMIDEFSIGNMLPQVPLSEKSNTEKPNKVVKNDKGQIVPMDNINEKDANTKLYFVTKADMKSKTTLEPRIPQNFLTDNGFEDNKIKRVCFSTSINGAVTALSQNLKNTDLFVYSPIGIEKRDIYTPSISQVPDRSITGEVWIRKPVQIECIGKIHVIDAKKNPQRYKYGNKIAELYEWNWKWIDKNINESVSSVYGAYDAHGKWNAAVDVDGRTYRYRVECLIINGNKVFVSLDKNGNLIIPGGSVEKDIDDITQVANECREEARINIKNPIYTGIDRIQGCPPHISKHKSVLPFEYDGSLSKVYVAEYDSDYNGYIDEYDKDEKMIRGKFVPIKDVVNRLKLEWREALNKYTNVYYRVTYNGEGIYNALKNNIPLNVWIGLLKSDAMRWLSKPPKYNESSRSYFTKEGFKMFMRKTYPVMRKYLNPEFVNIEEVRLPNKMMYSDKYQVVTESSETKYDPPYTYDEIVKNYGKDMADKLVADPAHKFRCHTGIELIHKEPSLSELNRIHSNWQLMTDEQKRKSDMKSRELFGCDNETNYTRLVKTYNEACKDVKTAKKFVSEVGKLAKKYDANYFIVTDGASGIHNNGNPAVKNARDSQVEWEKKHGFDPDEDWSKMNINESFVDNDLVMENLTDIPNGVNPYSRTKFFHLSMDNKLDGKTLTPRIPSWIKKFMEDNKEEFIKNMETVKNGGSTDKIYYYEEYKTPRVCFSSSINGCLNAILMDNGDRLDLVGKCVHVYVPEKPIDQYKHRTNKEIKKSGDIFDANITNEIWILEPVKVKYYGSIIVDSAKECRFLRKTTSDKNKTIAKFNYKWHWYLKERERKESNKNVNESVSNITSKSAKGPDDALAKDIRAVIKSLGSDDYKSFDYKSKKMYYQSVYYDGDNPIGFVFTRSFDEEGRHSLTISVALNPDYRGKGLALKMVRDVLNTIKQDKSIYQIYWGADMDNKGSIELAKRAGFKHNYDYRDSTFYTKVVNNTKNVNESTLIPCDDKKEGSMSVGNGKELTYDSDDWNRKVKVFSKGGSDIHCKKGTKVYRITNSPKESIGGKRKYVTLKKSDAIRYSHPKYGIITNPMSGKIITFSLTKDIKVAGVTTALKAISEVYGLDKFDFSDYKKFSFAAGSGRVLQKISDMGYDAVIDPEDISSGISKSSIIILSPKDVLSIDSCDDLSKNINESAKRSELPDDVFGIPQERKYPMQDKQHVKAAIKFFNYVEPKYEEQLANRIIENMKIYNIDASSIGDKNRLKKYIIEGSRYDMTHSLVKDLEFLYFESGDPDIPDLIEPIVKQLESKGYQVKYASPGHINTTFDNDKNKDGVINSKMTSTARIIFSRDYHFKTTPQGWEWKILQNDSKALYVKPYTYNEKMGPKDEAFKKWQTFYIDNMKSWVTDLPKAGSDAKSKPDVNF